MAQLAVYAITRQSDSTNDRMKYPIRFGKYLLLERINVGGMAEVFKAKAFGVEGFQRILAIKRILPNMSEDQEFINMFVDEARLAVQLNHANIVQIYELGKHDSQYYIAMEYVAGKDLRRIIEGFRKRKEAMPVPLAAYICAKICEGLDYAHRKGYPDGRPMNLVHRDISPQNMLVSYEGDVKIIDFGIAKAADRLSKTQAGVLKGKFGYMSPEQVAGAEIDRRSDLFAVGVLLYEMLTCTRLFVAETDFSTLEKVRQCEIPAMRELNDGVPEALEDVVRKALAKDLDERYQWCSDFNEDLQRFLITDQSIFNTKRMASFMKETFKDDIDQEMQKMQDFLRIQADDEGSGSEDAVVAATSHEATQIFEVGENPLASAETRVGVLEEPRERTQPGTNAKKRSGTQRVLTSDVASTQPFDPPAQQTRNSQVRRPQSEVRPAPRQEEHAPDNTKFILGGAIGLALFIIGGAIWFTQFRHGDDSTWVVLQVTPAVVPAELFVDKLSVQKGMTPFDKLRLPVGKHDIMVQSKDFDDLKTTVEFVAGKTNVLQLRLLPKSAPPPNPPPGSQPTTLPGNNLPGTALPGGTVTPPGGTQPPPARKVSLDLDSDPRGALIILNGNKIGVTPKRLDALDIGTRLQIELRLRGYHPLFQDWEIKGDDKLSPRLVKGGGGGGGGEEPPPHFGGNNGGGNGGGGNGGGHPHGGSIITIQGLGFLVVNTPGSPDTKVIVDGKDTKRATPVMPGDPIKLAPGTHAVTLVFTDSTKKSFQVNIASNETYKLIERK